jgi:hypothetical protein
MKTPSTPTEVAISKGNFFIMVSDFGSPATATDTDFIIWRNYDALKFKPTIFSNR